MWLRWFLLITKMVTPKKMGKVAFEQGLFINGISGIMAGSWHQDVINRKL